MKIILSYLEDMKQLETLNLNLTGCEITNPTGFIMIKSPSAAPTMIDIFFKAISMKNPNLKVNLIGFKDS